MASSPTSARTLITHIIFVCMCVRAFGRDCLPGQFRCQNTVNIQCCKHNQYCGLNSLECEDCFPHGATEEEKLQLCRGMKNVTDIAAKLRNANCTLACQHQFGAKLYECFSERADASNETGNDQQIDTPDKIQAPERSGDLSTAASIGIGCVIGCVATVTLGLGLLCLFKKRILQSFRSSPSGDKLIVDEPPRTTPGGQQEGSVDLEKGIRRRKEQDQGAKNVPNSEECQERLLPHQEDSTPGIHPQQQVDPGPSRTEASEPEAIEREGYQRESARAVPDADQFDGPTTGALQTNGAAASNGKSICPVTTASTENDDNPVFTTGIRGYKGAPIPGEEIQRNGFSISLNGETSSPERCLPSPTHPRPSTSAGSPTDYQCIPGQTAVVPGVQQSARGIAETF